jgi:VWFA-related protein
MTKTVRCGLAIAVVASALSTALVARQQKTRAQPSSASDVTAILVDVVVRDRAGQPVADLRPDEVVLTEDGVQQDVGSFTRIFRDKPAANVVSTAAPTSALTPVVPAVAAPPSNVSVPEVPASGASANSPGEVMALVFDRLTPEARTLAYRAALQYASMEQTNRIMSVYGIDLGLVPFQGFTRDMARIRKAIEEFGVRSTSQFGSTRQERAGLQEQAFRAGQGQASAEQAAGGPGGAGAQAIAGAAGDAQFAQMQQNMLQTFDALERDQRGYSTANALMAVVSSMRHLPGRKAMVFFSEGLSIPPDVQERFTAVIAAANRANVSIYSVDAIGLRTESTLKETREEVMAAGRRTLSRDPSRDVTGEPMIAALERNENNLRLDPHSGLGQLADQTGGLLVSNTNDFRKGLARVDSDLQNYYMLSYVPKNAEFDGRFRAISLKVTRPGVTVQHRKGYFAVRAPAGVPVLSYEAPALATLDRTPVPNAFPVRAVALRFPEQGRPGLTPIIVELPTASLAFEPMPDDNKVFHADATVLVRFTDDSGTVIDKMSQRYELKTTAEGIDRARQGEVIFYRQPELPTGVYRMETVVYDALAKKASVRFSTVEKPAVDTTRLRLSSLMLVQRGEKVPETERVATNPLYVGDTLLYPNLGAPLKRGLDKEVGFYFAAYVLASGGDAKAVLELLLNAKPLAQVPLDLAAPDAEHRIQQVSRIPIEQLAAGTYELRVTVHQGSTSASQTTSFRVSD